MDRFHQDMVVMAFVAYSEERYVIKDNSILCGLRKETDDIMRSFLGKTQQFCVWH